MQAVHGLTATSLLLAVELVTHLEIFALLISAICHDFEHPGLNNTFLANTSNSLALRYNDRSILENHHCARYGTQTLTAHTRRTHTTFGIGG